MPKRRDVVMLNVGKTGHCEDVRVKSTRAIVRVMILDDMMKLRDVLIGGIPSFLI